MDKLEDNFYKNQDIVFQTPQKNYRGFITNIEGGYLYIILYAYFSEKKIYDFDEEEYDIGPDVAVINGSKDSNLIYQDTNHTYLYKLSVAGVIRNVKNIMVKAAILELISEREGREFLRISTLLQFIYEEIKMEDFLEIKDEYILKPSFSTSVYGIYNLAAPKMYQPSAGGGENESPINPHTERLLIAINSKLDVILSLLNPEASIFANVEEKKVSISGSGMMFNEPVFNLKQGAIIKIILLFPTVPQFTVKAVAQVAKIKKNENNDEYNIACKFIAINESDRDEIIKFTLDKQRQQIKNS